MNILFISFEEVSLSRGSVRAVAMLRALADAGHRVDLVAPLADLPEHPQIRVVAGSRNRPIRRRTMRMHCMRAASRGSYDAVHAFDEAVFFAVRLSRWKKIPLVYDAAHRFSGSGGIGLAGIWRLFPRRLQRMEAKVLGQATVVFSSCGALTADLMGIDKTLEIEQVEDIPSQSLYPRRAVEKEMLIKRFGKRPDAVVVCCQLPGAASSLRDVLMAARKVIDAMPNAAFFFQGAQYEQAGKMAESLDIAARCAFLSPEEPEAFLSALEIADAIFMAPQRGGRYIHPLVYTLLHAGAPLVTVHDTAYDELLTDKTSVHVLPSSDAIAEGLLRVAQEPLFSLAVATEGQLLVAQRYTCSSFKHKVRMIYHRLSKAAS
ncbi:glycosyltransferase [Pontiella sulfatireligans]|uniref:Glycosyltransferase subfamily 4-like N-terminal domain-containing protein n=1 Tax=Pontiella sulfatireligans TaxID=2750658 RepID=A0A6C2UQG6_9BACT|nr:glycosyltransferase [Pontiella sulfatireligans]VGO21246.1 hypothetical protein SCARR_03318 [Pontiella sulfatireligans]